MVINAIMDIGISKNVSFGMAKFRSFLPLPLPQRIEFTNSVHTILELTRASFVTKNIIPNDVVKRMGELMHLRPQDYFWCHVAGDKVYIGIVPRCCSLDAITIY